MPQAIPLIMAAGSVSAGVTAMAAATTLTGSILGGMMIAGGALVGIGAITGSAKLQKWGGILSLAGGVAGLAAARALRLQGQNDFALLELEDSAGGNARGGTVGGIACPLGAHYLPLPGDDAPAVLAGSGSQIHEIVGPAHRGFVMLDDDYRIS